MSQITAQRITDIPGINYLWRVDNLYLGGHPTQKTFEVLKEKGIAQVFNLTGIGETDISADKEFCLNNDIEFHHIPIMCPLGIYKEGCEQINDLLSSDKLAFIHCASGNRVAGWLITYLVAKRGVEFEAAVEIAQNAGLRTVDFIYQAENIIS